MPDEKMKIVETAKVTYEFGDKKFQALYGPEDDKGERKLIGFIDESFVDQIQKIFDEHDSKEE